MKTNVPMQSLRTKEMLELIGNKGSIQVFKAGEIAKIHVQPGEKYRIVKKHGTSEVLADDVVATRVGDSLHLQYADGTLVSLEGFYAVEGAELALPANDGGVHTVSSQLSLATDSSNFVYAHGDSNVLMSMTQADHALQMAVVEHTSVSNLPHFAELAAGVATDAVAGGASAGGGAAAATAGATGAAAGLSTAAMVGLGALGVGAVAVAAGGGGGGSSAPAAPVVDTVAPTATITMADTALKIGDTSLVTVTFSEAVTGFANADLTVANGTLSTLSSSDGGITWTATFTPTATIEDATNVITLATTYTDVAGNTGTTATSANYTVDTVAPVLTGVLAHGVSKTIVLTYNEALSTTNLPATTAFTINTDGAGNVVTAVAVSGSTITLTLTSAFTVVTNISYADPSGGNDVNAIQDIAGNDAVAIVNLGSGVVADGYIRGAQLWIDTNNDGTADYNTGVVTDANGNFFLAPGTPSGSIVAIGGVNIDTGVPNTMPLRAPAGSTVINPLTTLVQAIIQANPGTSAATASASVVTALGLTGGTNLTTFDPLANGGDLAAQKAAATVATIISIGAGSNTADTTTIIANLVQEIQTGTVIDFTDSTTLTNVLDGVSVSAQEISDIANATTSIDNAATLANIATAQSVALDTVAAGISTLTASTVTNDPTPAVRVNLNITSTDGTAVVAGDIVVLKVDGIQVGTATLTATEIAAGFVNINSSALSEGTHSISAVIVDQAGNISSAYPSVSIIIDTTAPTAPTVGAVTVDNVINLSEKTAGVTLTGTTESGSTVTVLGNAATVTGTTWSYTFTAANYTTMGEGTEAVSIVATDTAGNTATTTKNITVDTVASTVTATITGAADNVGTTGNIANAGTTDDNTLGLSGTISTTLGSGEVVAIYDGSTRLGAATVTSTNWTFDTASLSNAAHSFTARVEDAAGNKGTSSSAYTLTVNATLPTATATIDAMNAASNDTTPALAGTIVGTLGGSDIVQVYADGVLLGAATVTGAAWSYTPSALAAGTYSFTAVVENNAGNQGTMSSASALIIDTTAPTVTITDDQAGTGNIAGGNIIYTFTFSEAVTGFSVGDIVVANGVAGTLTAVSSTVYTLVVTPTAGFEGNVTVDVAGSVAIDAAGNNNTIATQSVQAVDMLAPTVLTITDVATNNAINAGEKTAGVSVSGTAENNALVTLTLGNGNIHTVTANGSGAWTYALTDADYTSIAAGTTITATATDAAGNVSTPVSKPITVDTVAPLLTVNAMATDDVINITEKTATVTATGITEAGATVTVNGNAATVSGNTWSYVLDATAIDAMGQGAETLTVVATDAAGNTTTRTKAISVDTVAPTVTITDDEGSTGNIAGGNITYTFTFNEAVTGFAVGDITVVGGAKGTFTAVSSTVYTLVVTPTAGFEGNVTVDVASAVAIDANNNNNPAARQSIQAVDMLAPTATITMADTALKIGDTSVVTITFSEAVTGFANTDVTVANGTVDTFVTSDSGVTWTATFTPEVNITDTTNVITLANSYTDVVLNTGTVATSANYTVDTVAPTATITMADTALKIGDTSVVTIVFSEAVAGFTNIDVTVTNGTLGTLTTSDNITWTATFTPTATIEDATNVISLANSYIDVAGNTGATATSANYTVDTVAPTATITMADTALKIGDTSLVTIVFSEAVTGFANADVTVANGTLGTLTTSDNITWTATFTPTATIEDATNVITLATTYTDVALNTGTVATSANYVVDTTAPTVTISAISGGYVNNAEDESAVVVSGTTTGVEDAQTITVTINSVAYTATVASNAWTLNVPSVDIKLLTEGTITATANVSDAAGNPASQASQTFVYDLVAPTVSSAATASVSENVSASTAVYTAAATTDGNGAYNYSLSGADAAKFAISSTTGAVTFVASPDFETPTDTGANNVYDITVTATDAAGNPSSAQAVAITVNNVDVTINTVATDDIINAAEKTSGVILSGTNEPGATVTLNIGGTTRTASVSNTSWSYALIAADYTAIGEGTETLSITSGGTTITKNINVDTVAPTATITMADTALKIGDTSLVTIVFSEAVAGFSNADVTVANGVVDTFVTSDNITWTATFTPAGSITDTTNVISLANTYTDTVLNTGTVATSANYVVDTVAPTVTITDDQTGTGNIAGGTILYTFTFSEDVAGLTIDDITVANATKGAFTQVSQSVYTILVTPTAGFTGNVTVDVAANVAYDGPGNLNTAATQSVQAVDMLAPAIIIASGFTYTDTGVANGITSNGTINVTLASDTSTWQYSLNNGTSWIPGTGSSFVLSEGSHDKSDILVKQFDLAGNSSISSMNSKMVQLEAIGNTAGADTFARSIAVGTAGEYVVAFQGFDSNGDSSIFLQKFNADGTVTGDMVQLEAFGNTIGYDHGVRMSAVGDAGAYVVTFRGQDVNATGDRSIFVQKFNADGTVAGNMVQLEAIGNTTGADDWSRITAVGTTGEYVVTFEGVESTGDKSIFVQKFNADGTIQGSMVQLEAIGNAAGDDTNPHITAVGTAGAYVVSFVGADSAGDTSIYVQKFNADGTIAGSMLQLEALGNTTGADSSLRIIAVGTTGEYVVTFTGTESAGDTSIFVQKFNADGTIQGSMVQLEAIGNTTGADTNAQITAVGTAGEYVVSFVGTESAGDNSIFVQKFNADGTIQGSMVQLEAFGNTTGADSNPRITAVGTTGEYVVSFVGAESAGDNSIFVQKFNADGTLAGAMVQLEAFGNTTGADAYARPISVGTAGEYVVTFEGVESSGDYSIFVQKFNADGTLAITVDTVAPVFSSGTSTIITENFSPYEAVYIAAAPTDANGAYTYSFGGGVDDARFTINALTGVVDFILSPDYEAPIDTGANNVYDIIVTATDAAGNATDQNVAITVQNDYEHNVVIINSTLVPSLVNITAFPTGTTFTDGAATIAFTSATAATLTEPDGITTHTLTLSNGIASTTVDTVTYSYKLLTVDGSRMVLAQTDTNLTAEMNGYVDGPPPIWSLISTTATVMALPTGSVTLYSTDTENFGDRWGDWTKLTFDFTNHTIQGYAIDGSTDPLENFTVSGNQMLIHQPDGKYDSIVSVIANADGYYTVKEDYTDRYDWGITSGQGASDITAYLSAHSDILWNENGQDYNGNGTSYDYGLVTRSSGTVSGFTVYTSNTVGHTDEVVDYMATATLSTNALVIDEGDEVQTFSIDNNIMNVVAEGTAVFSGAIANPFNVTYAYEVNNYDGTVGIGLHDGMSLTVADLMGTYSNTGSLALAGIDSDTDTAANTIIVTADDVLAMGMSNGTGGYVIAIDAGTGDTVNLTGWTDTTANQTVNGIVFDIYQNNTSQTAFLAINVI